MENFEYMMTHHAVLSQGAMWVIFGVVVLALLFFDCFLEAGNKLFLVDTFVNEDESFKALAYSTD